MDTMSVSPGVVLQERGKQKGGGNVVQPKTMSRKEYSAVVEKGGHGAMSQNLHTLGEQSEQARKNEVMDPPELVQSTVVRDMPAAVEPELAPPIEEVTVVDRTSATASYSPRARSGGGAPSMKIVRAPDLGTELLGMTPHPPSAPRPMQPAPPLEVRRALKQQALGHAASARE
eukprot:4761597-Amphidinium_carterae.1